MIKSLIEQKNAKLEDMKRLLGAAKTENRAMSTEEATTFDKLDEEVRALDITIKAEERARDLELNVASEQKKKELTAEQIEERAFDSFLRDAIENRADMTKTANGAIIPKSIAKRIMETVKDISTIYQRATKYNMKGELVFPVYDETTEKITCAYQTEFTAMTSKSGKFTSISLTGFLAGALTKVSLSLVNNNDFDLVNYVVMKMAEAITDFFDKECLVGTAGKMTGALSSTNKKVAAAQTAITGDELISLKLKVKKRFQKDAVWIMHPDTYEVVAKLKDGQGNYLVINNFTTGFEPMLLGKPIELDENMPTLAAGAKAIVYGDFSGLTIKIAEDVNIQVLREKYADEHVVGVIGWVEADSNITEPQKIAVLQMAA
ncbi:MAG: phage major capsid protein [Herbinix sp.]|jgi:HK97 family phage major capsid protein|nr:phage major capsid protein [Herbinix sp.]